MHIGNVVYVIFSRICGGCNSDIGSGNYLGCMGTFFHPECFRCHSCGYAITEHEVYIYAHIYIYIIINILLICVNVLLK